MREAIPAETRFSFRRRPVPVPGDLRISWRLPLLLMMLGTSRGKKASLAKLNVLNDALRSETAGSRLKQIIFASDQGPTWGVRVEPAFSRAIDFLVGEKLAQWVELSDKSGLQLTATGIKAAEAVLQNNTALVAERAFIMEISKGVTEGLVAEILGARRQI